MRFILTLLLLGHVMNSAIGGEFSVQGNLVYGMYSGTALLMDAYIPDAPNGYGLIHISGSGWHAPIEYQSRQLKESSHVRIFVKPLAEAGFTVFTINHRAAPGFRYPAAVEDAQRAVRFIRHHADRYGIRKDRIGAIGGSSGGHLVSLLGVLDGTGRPDDADPIERESAKVQCVVARAAPTNFLEMDENTAVVSFLGMPNLRGRARGLYEQASPMTHVSSDDAPFLLLHGDKDEVVPIAQSHNFKAVLEKAGVPAKLIVVEGAGHGPHFPDATSPPNLIPKIADWFKLRLLSE
jgi:acetyl esterase/lipase